MWQFSLVVIGAGVAIGLLAAFCALIVTVVGAATAAALAALRAVATAPLPSLRSVHVRAPAGDAPA